MTRSALFLVVIATALRADELPLRKRIDNEVSTAWKTEKVTPSAVAGDAEFLRRVTIDLVGTIPTFEELSAFLADKDARKREKAIDRLLADARFARNQAKLWELVLLGRESREQDLDQGRRKFREWLAGKLTGEANLRALAGGLLRAEEDGSELFLAQFRNKPEDAAEVVSRVILGTQLQCARCHDHPFDSSLTQRDFYGMAGFFVRLVARGEGDAKSRRFRIGERATGEVLFTGPARDARPGKKGEPVKPKFLGGAALEEPPVPKGFKDERSSDKLPPKPAFSRKEKLAEWVTSTDNPYFTRAMANRVWSQFMGRGVVHPVDDFGGKNPPSLPGLLDHLTRGLANGKHSLRAFVREIVLSEAYQLSHKGGPPDALPRLYQRARVRPLSAEELLEAMRTATAYDTSGGKPSGSIEEYFRIYFGRPTNGQGEFQGGLMEHLFLNNSDQLRTLIRRRKGNLADAMLTEKDAGKRIDRLFLSVLSRHPSAKEREKFEAYIAGEKPEAKVEEVIWVLLNSAEFRFQH